MLDYIILPCIFLIILSIVLILSDLYDVKNYRILKKICNYYKDKNESKIKILLIYLKHKKIKEIRDKKINYLISDKILKELYLTDSEINYMNKLNNSYLKCINLLDELDIKLKNLDKYTYLANKFLEEPTNINHIKINIDKLNNLYNKIEEQYYENYKNKKEEKRKKELNSIFAEEKKNKFMAVLGLNTNTELDLKLLKKQYRLLSKKYHPDRFVGIKSEIEIKNINDKFVEINNAYEYLLNNYL